MLVPIDVWLSATLAGGAPNASGGRLETDLITRSEGLRVLLHKASAHGLTADEAHAARALADALRRLLEVVDEAL
jgi:hypothetical protein